MPTSSERRGRSGRCDELVFASNRLGQTVSHQRSELLHALVLRTRLNARRTHKESRQRHQRYRHVH